MAVTFLAGTPGFVKAQTMGEGFEPDSNALQDVQVRAQRPNDLQQRRFSNASKTVVGREEIQKYGDTSLEDVLRRQPGVTVPSGGGNPRLRGMAEGYTQILIDGQPAGRGFTIDSIQPEQVERLEIIRVPTAETGGQAVAGSVNIITREGQARGRKDLSLGLSLGERDLQGFRLGLTQQGAWLGDESMISATVFGRTQESRSEQSLQFVATADPSAPSGQSSQTRSEQERLGLSLRGQASWNLQNQSSVSVRPMVFAVKGDTQSLRQIEAWRGSDPLSFASPYLQDDATQRFHYAVGRVLLLHKWNIDSQWRLETGLTGSAFEFKRDEESLVQTVTQTPSARQTNANTEERGLLLSSKLKRAFNEDEQTFGFELEQTVRTEEDSRRVDDVLYQAGLGNELDTDQTRWAVYGQWDFNPSPQWALLAGLRHESIQTSLQTLPSLPRQNHESELTSPSLSLVHRPAKDPSLLYRLSLSHAYKRARARDLSSLPSLSTSFNPNDANTPDAADSVGNPDLRPEQSWGLDLSLEKSPVANSLLSAGIFWKQIKDVQRRQTQLETVSWSSVPRWVNRPRNLGEADLIGLELEARAPARLWAQWLGLGQAEQAKPKAGSSGGAASGLEFRASLSHYWSQLESLDGPNNRLPGQPAWELKLGFDARPAKSKLRYGASLGYTKAARYQAEPQAWVEADDDLTLEAYGLYSFDRNQRLRFTVQDLARWSSESTSLRVFDQGNRIEAARQPGRLRASLRYELGF
ncbi:MAG: TonB-dependent receptor plug domain-containing protein [Burkholderiaceae bacterium]